MSRPRQIDITAREVRDQLELAAIRGDAELALDAARKYERLGLVVSVWPSDFVMREPDSQVGMADTAGHAAPAFVGRPIINRYAGSCRVCGSPIDKGDRALWRKGEGIAHAACGVADA